MNIISKELIPDKEWIIRENGIKIGTLTKSKKGFSFLKNGKKILINNLENLKINIPKKTIGSSIPIEENSYIIYEYPCSSKPYYPVYNLQKKLPIFAKSSKSKSLFCAGYYIIKFRKGWVKSFCPKMITLERYAFKGPYKTEHEMRNELLAMNKHETY